MERKGTILPTSPQVIDKKTLLKTEKLHTLDLLKKTKVQISSKRKELESNPHSSNKTRNHLCCIQLSITGYHFLVFSLSYWSKHYFVDTNVWLDALFLKWHLLASTIERLSKGNLLSTYILLCRSNQSAPACFRPLGRREHHSIAKFNLALLKNVHLVPAKEDIFLIKSLECAGWKR